MHHNDKSYTIILRNQALAEAILVPSRSPSKREIEELRRLLRETETTVKNLQEDIARLKQRVFYPHKRGQWIRNPSHIVNAITLIALILGAGFQMWLNRPVVDFQLSAPTMSDYYYTYPPDPLPPPPLEFYFKAVNTGQTDITIDVVITAVNATVSSTKDGTFNQTATERIFISAKTESDVSFYARVNYTVTSFNVRIWSVSLVASPDRLTTLVDYGVTYNAINALELVWLRQPPQEYQGYHTATFALQT